VRPPRLQWVALCLVVSLLVPFGAVQYRNRQGERAKAQLLLAVHLTGNRLQQAQKKVLESSRMDTRI
jgi:hypothetical protein